MDPKINRTSVMKAYEWCKKKYGRSKYNGRYPEVQFRKEDYLNEGLWGCYDFEENHIYISSTLIEEFEDMVATVIHEYTHYLQSRLEFRVLSKYFDPASMDHPLEREAEEVSARDKAECMREAFGII